MAGSSSLVSRGNFWSKNQPTANDRDKFKADQLGQFVTWRQQMQTVGSHTLGRDPCNKIYTVYLPGQI